MKRFLRMSYLAAAIGGIGFFAMSVLLLGVWPGRALDEQIRQTSPAHPLIFSASEQRGRKIYAREGCAYCHTQQIRYLKRDVDRFGKATLAWETIFDYPQLWGTRRIGPDLSRESSIRSADWQLSHLYAPRTIVRDSVMPAFPWLFDGAPDRPRQEGLDLLAYLETLGRDRALAGPEADVHAASAHDLSAAEKEFAFGPGPLNASAAMPRRKGKYPVLPISNDHTRGQELYERDCASCHGPRGAGDGPGGAGLRPRPANFTEHEYKLDRLSQALWNGVSGAAMPAWRDVPATDLAAVASIVRGFHTPQPEPKLPPDILELGAQVYADHCAQCHGDKGAGDGSAADQFPMAPANFQTQRPTIAAALRAFRNGVEGSPMAPWSEKLSEGELSAVAYFVRGFYR